MTDNEREEAVNALASTVVAVRQLVEGLSEASVRWKPSYSEFSVVENICHLRDIEVDGYTLRIRKILTDDHPFLVDLDGSRLATERDYNSQGLSDALEAFANSRHENVRLIRELSPDQLMRTGMLENTGEITLRRLIELMREHDAAHVRELGALRKNLTDFGVL